MDRLGWKLGWEKKRLKLVWWFTSPEMPGSCFWLLTERRVTGNTGSQSCGCSPRNQGRVSSNICTECTQAPQPSSTQGTDFLLSGTLNQASLAPLGDTA